MLYGETKMPFSLKVASFIHLQWSILWLSNLSFSLAVRNTTLPVNFKIFTWITILKMEGTPICFLEECIRSGNWRYWESWLEWFLMILYFLWGGGRFCLLLHLSFYCYCILNWNGNIRFILVLFFPKRRNYLVNDCL